MSLFECGSHFDFSTKSGIAQANHKKHFLKSVTFYKIMILLTFLFTHALSAKVQYFEVAPDVKVDCDIDTNFYRLSIRSPPKVGTSYQPRNVTGVVSFFETFTIKKTEYTVSRILNYAFANTSVTEIIIPKTIFYIGASAFAYCPKLTRVDLSKSPLYHLAPGIFNNSWNLEELIMPSTIVSINSYTFASIAISSFTITKNIRSIEGSSFSNCTNLKNFEILSTNRFFIFENGVIYSYFRKKLIYSVCTIEKPVLHPDVQIIGSYSFAHSNVYVVQVPSSVESIENYAFYECHNLRAVKFFHSALKTLGEYVFMNSGLRYITLPRMLNQVGHHCFSIPTLKDIDISMTNVTKFPRHLFTGVTKMEILAIPDETFIVDPQTFSGSSIKKIFYCGVFDAKSLQIPDTIEVVCDKKLPIGDEI